MTHAALAPLIGPEFDQFLGAAIGEDRNGTTLSVLSALARLDVDPWREAASLARMSREAAAERLTALIDALPHDEASEVESKASPADLVALLPKSKTPGFPTSDNAFVANGFRPRPMLVGLGALVLMLLIVFAMSARFPTGSEDSAHPLAPRAADATIAPPPKRGP
jgi:hypothetical protein